MEKVRKTEIDAKCLLLAKRYDIRCVCAQAEFGNEVTQADRMLEVQGNQERCCAEQ